jgi:hypothetical protein
MMRSRLPKSHAPAARLGLDGDGSAGDLTAADREASQSPKAKRIASGRDGRGLGCAAIHASRLSSSDGLQPNQGRDIHPGLFGRPRDLAGVFFLELEWRRNRDRDGPERQRLAAQIVEANLNERSAGFVATLSSAQPTIGDIVNCTQRGRRGDAAAGSFGGPGQRDLSPGSQIRQS